MHNQRFSCFGSIKRFAITNSFLPIHALTAAIFSFWYKECLLLAEIADSKRLCEVLSVFEIFEEIPWSVNCGSIGVGGLRGGTHFVTRNIFLFIGWCIVCFFIWLFFIWYFFWIMWVYLEVVDIRLRANCPHCPTSPGVLCQQVF